MKSTFFPALAIISLASALPFEQVEVLDARQVGSANSNDLKDGKCARNVFIFARGSTETGNMVRLTPLNRMAFLLLIRLLSGNHLRPPDLLGPQIQLKQRRYLPGCWRSGWLHRRPSQQFLTQEH